MATVMASSPPRQHIPAPMRMETAWVCYRMTQRPGEPKPQKLPYYANGQRRHGKQGSPEDRRALVTADEALDAQERDGHSGVGFAPRKELGFVALDFDNIRRPDGSVDPILEPYIGYTYVEWSPSNNGARVILKGDLKEWGDRKYRSLEGGLGFETFCNRGFVTMTGNVFDEVAMVGHEDRISPINEHTWELCRKFFGARSGSPGEDDFMAGFEPKLHLPDEIIRDHVFANDPSCPREPWRTVGMAIHHETGGSDAGFDIWHEWSQEGDNYTGEEGMRYQWDRFREDGSGRSRVTMASVIKMANEARAEGGKPLTAEILRDEVIAAQPDTFDGKFRPVRASALSTKPTQWLVKGIVPRTEDPVILFGSSGAGKSFVALDIACALSRGTPWRGHRTTKCRVLYVAAEGMGGIRKRLQAYCRKHELEIDDLDIDVIGASPNILEAEDVKEITRSIAAFGPYDLVIVDTLAQVTPGANENAGEDMGKALANIKAVQRATHSTVMVIHHAGKDTSKGARGWSGIKAAAEAQIEVCRDEETGARHIHIEKMKDGEDGARLGFALESMVLAMDEDGDEVTSCVVVEAEFVARSREPSGKTGAEYRSPLQTAIVEAIQVVDPNKDAVKLGEFVDVVLGLLPAPEGRRDARRQSIRRAIEGFSKKAEAPLALKGDIVVFYE